MQVSGQYFFDLQKSIYTAPLQAKYYDMWSVVLAILVNSTPGIPSELFELKPRNSWDLSQLKELLGGELTQIKESLNLSYPGTPGAS